MKVRNRQSFKTRTLLSSAAMAAVTLASGQSRAAQTTLSLWDFNQYDDATHIDNPTPDLAFGTVTGNNSAQATSLGMTNNYLLADGSTHSITFCDMALQGGSTNPTGESWRVRGQQNIEGPQKTNNGWSTAAPQNTQGVEFDISTVGQDHIHFQYDWFVTGQGIQDLRQQYTIDGGNNWTTISATGSDTLTEAGGNNLVYTPYGGGWRNAQTIDFTGIAGVDNNALFGVRLVSAFNPTLGNYAGATTGTNSADHGGPVVYNNKSGNWRWQDVSFYSSGTNVVANPPTLTWNPPGNSWNTNTTNLNWKDTNGASVAFLGGPTNTTAAFTNSGLTNGTGIVNVDMAGISAAAITLSHTGTYTFTGGAISGKYTQASGNVVLQSANNFGSLEVDGGTLHAAADANLGSSSARLTLNGGTFVADASMALNRFVVTGSNGGSIDSNGHDVTLSKLLSAQGPFTKLGAGNLILTGSVTGGPNGFFTLAQGNLILSQTSGTSVIIAPNTTGGFSGNIIIQNKSLLGINGGTVDSANGSTIQIQTSGGGVGGDSSGGTSLSHVVINENILLNSLNKAGAFISSLGMNGTGNSLTINGQISGSSSVRWDGGKALVTLNHTNTYVGDTIINNGDIGIIQLGAVGAMSTGNLTFGDGKNGAQIGVLDLNGFNQTFASITADGVSMPQLLVPPGQKAGGIANTSTSLANLTISGTATTTFTSTIGTPQFTTINGGLPANHIALILGASNTGKLTLNANNNFDGGVVINGGTLQINPNIYISGTNNAGENSSSLPDFSNVQNNATFIVNAAGSTAAQATLANVVSGTGTTTVTAPGVLTANTLSQTSLVNSGVTTINTAGTIGSISNGTASGSLFIGNGSAAAVTVGSFAQGSVTISDQAKLTVAVTTPRVTNTTSSLTLNGSGTLDVGNNHVVVNYGGGTSPASGIRSSIISGMSSGNGIVSSQTAGHANTAVGYVDGNDNAPTATNVLAGTVKFGYALQGDTGLRGTVDLQDYLLLASHFHEAAPTKWSDGDFNYDNAVDLQDYLLLAQNFHGTVSPAVKRTLAAAKPATLTGGGNVVVPAGLVNPGNGKLALEVDPSNGHVYLVGNNLTVSAYNSDSAGGLFNIASGKNPYETLKINPATAASWNVLQAVAQHIAENVTNGTTAEPFAVFGSTTPGTNYYFDLTLSGGTLWTGTSAQVATDLAFDYGDGALQHHFGQVINLVPEPTTLAFIGFGAAGLLARRRRSQKQMI